MFRENLNKIVQGYDLSESEMSQMITEIFSGNVTDAQIGALMAALAWALSQGMTLDEMARWGVAAGTASALSSRYSATVFGSECRTPGLAGRSPART